MKKRAIVYHTFLKGFCNKLHLLYVLVVDRRSDEGGCHYPNALDSLYNRTFVVFGTYLLC